MMVHAIYNYKPVYTLEDLHRTYAICGVNLRWYKYYVEINLNRSLLIGV